MTTQHTAVVVLAILSLSACSDTPTTPQSPTAADRVQDGQQAMDHHRPFAFYQAWDSAGNDFSNPCSVLVPNPADPGNPINVMFPGVTSGQGVATHVGRHTVRFHFADCSWNGALGAVNAGGPWEVEAANGDSLWGTYAGQWYLSGAGGTFSGEMVIAGGTGRFDGASGRAPMEAHDNANWSGWDKGTGWIAY